jgi:flagellar protein FlaG
VTLSVPSIGLSDVGATGLVAAAPGPATLQSAAPENADLGLVIEDDKAAGEYVYKTVNRVTGQVVSQWPSQQVLQLRAADNYSPGTLVSQVA